MHSRDKPPPPIAFQELLQSRVEENPKFYFRRRAIDNNLLISYARQFFLFNFKLLLRFINFDHNET